MSPLRLFAWFCIVSLLLSNASAQKTASESQSPQQSTIQPARELEINGQKVVIFSRTPSVPSPSPDTPATGVAPLPMVNLPLVPEATPPGGPGFTLTVNGSGFVSNATVNWNGTVLPTTFVNQGQLTATVPAANIASNQTVSVTVTNPAPGGGTSNSVPFTVTVPSTGLTFLSVPLSLGPYASSVVVADFNNDGKLDLAVMNEQQPDPSCYTYGGVGTVSVFLGNGDGTFYSKSTLCLANLLASVGAAPMTVGDFNGDGNQDLVASSLTLIGLGGYYEDLFLGNGDGTFGPVLGYNVYRTDTLGPMIVGDFNNDGNLDLAFPYMDDDGLWFIVVLLGNGEGTFSGGWATAVSDPPIYPISQIVAGDFNGDGILDLAATTSVPGAGLVILLGDGNGRFTLASTQPSTSPVGSYITTADFDGDGKLDLAIAAGESSTLTVLHGNGDGTFTQVSAPPVSPPIGSTIIATDINGDGKLDVVSGSNVFLGNGDGTFQAGLTIANDPGAIAVGDFNNDGRLDILTGAAVLLQGPLASTTTLSSSPNPSSPRKPVTFTATISSSSGTPTGLVVFLTPNGTAPLGFGFLQSGSATFTTSVLPTGTDPIVAVYGGDPTHSSSTSNIVNQVVLTATTATLTSSPNPSTYGQPVTFAANVTSSIGAPPNGETVTFKKGEEVLGTGQLSGGTAIFTTSTLRLGTTKVDAVYAGDTHFIASKSNTVTQVVNKAP